MTVPCSTCGAPLDADAKFCTTCGSKTPPVQEVVRPAPPVISTRPVEPEPRRPDTMRMDTVRTDGGTTRGGIVLLPHESVLASCSGAGYEVVLTDCRVVSRGSTLGSSAESMIPLAHLDSVFIGRDRKIGLLILGALALLGGLYTQEPTILFVAALFLGLWWFLARTGALFISASGHTKIALAAGATGIAAVTDFVTAVATEVARRDRALFP